MSVTGLTIETSSIAGSTASCSRGCGDGVSEARPHALGDWRRMPPQVVSGPPTRIGWRETSRPPACTGNRKQAGSRTRHGCSSLTRKDVGCRRRSRRASGHRRALSKDGRTTWNLATADVTELVDANGERKSGEAGAAASMTSPSAGLGRGRFRESQGLRDARRRKALRRRWARVLNQRVSATPRQCGSSCYCHLRVRGRQQPAIDREIDRTVPGLRRGR